MNTLKVDLAGAESERGSESEIVACPNCGHHVGTAPVADRVAIHGMYDMHLFHPVEGATVDEVIANWRQHNATLHPATVDGREVDDMGPSSLCPAIVLAGKKELRRVGSMVFQMGNERAACDKAALKAWRDALLADPDIPRLLESRQRKAASALPPDNAEPK